MVRKWDPFRDLLTLHDQMSRLFELGESQRRAHSDGFAGWHPAADVSEDESAIYLHIEIPGMNESSLNLVVEDRTLILRGERRRSRVPGTTYLQSEILTGPFQRRFYLPAQVQSDRISAHYKNGILEVVIPKKQEAGQVVPIARKD
jgi:HSP20 family protein